MPPILSMPSAAPPFFGCPLPCCLPVCSSPAAVGFAAVARTASLSVSVPALTSRSLFPLSLGFPLTVIIVYTFIRVMSIGYYTFFRANMHKKTFRFLCNITLDFVYFLSYNNDKMVIEGLKSRRQTERSLKVPLVYKIDVLQALKDKGYNTNRLRKEKILAESTIQKLRENKPISWENISKICELLNCQPNYFLENGDAE